MELRHLRYFSALAERLNFTRAAEDVHVTQSTLSHQIKQLEDELGTPLFQRAGKRVTLTAEGQLFLPAVTKALKEIDSGIVTLKDVGTPLVGEVLIGTTHTFNLSLIPACLSAFLTKNPAVRIRVEELPAIAVCERVAAGDLDIGIAYPPSDTASLSFEPLYNEELVLAVGEKHAFAARRRIRMVELHRQRIVLLSREFSTRALLDSFFRSVGAEPIVVVEMNTIAPMLDLTRKIDIATIVPENAVPKADGLKAIRIENPKPIRTPSIIWKRGKPQPGPVKSFARIVKQMALRNGGT
jgi:LysR family transcriptional regulator, cyn operon transcriptional activator